MGKYKSIVVMVLITLGTIVAAVGGAKLPEADRMVSGIGVALLVAAFVINRWIAAAGEGGAVGEADPVEQIQSLPTRVDELVALAPTATLEELARRLGDLQTDVLTPLSDRLPSLLSRFGAERYAAVIGPYAQAERALARSWSAASDGHRAEAVSSIGRASEALREAIAELPDRRVSA